jgi:hypothetical protein
LWEFINLFGPREDGSEPRGDEQDKHPKENVS